jgi:hypothetical protein
VLSILYEKYGNKEILKGEGNFYLQYRGEELQGKGVILAKRIGSFRLEILGPFLQPLYVITYHQGMISFLSLREKKLYRGFEGSESYKSVTPFLIDPTLFLSFLFGELPITVSQIIENDSLFTRKAVQGGMDLDKKLYHLHIHPKGGSSYEMWIDPQNVFMVEGGIYNSAGERVSSVKVEKFAEVNGGTFPKRIRGEYADGIILKVDFQRISFLDSVNEESFTLSPPPGIEIYDF